MVDPESVGCQCSCCCERRDGVKDEAGFLVGLEGIYRYEEERGNDQVLSGGL